MNTSTSETALNLRAYVEYSTVLEGVSLGYLCSMDGTPCEVETSDERYGEDADGNRGVWVTYARCRKCHEPPADTEGKS